MESSQLRILAVAQDLMFVIQILNTAKQMNMTCLSVKTREDALRVAAEGVAGVVLDLNFTEADPLGLIRELKSREDTKGIPLLAYVPHVQVSLKQTAEDAGCDLVIPRSAFASRLPQVLTEWTSEQRHEAQD